MNDLPNDILYEICTVLRPKELINLSESNKKLNTFVNLRWDDLNSVENKSDLIRRYIKVVLASFPIEEALKAIDMSECKLETQIIIKNKFTKMYEKIMKAYEPHMFDMFSYDELTLLVKFTCSPEGANIITKQAKSQQAIMPILSESINKTIAKVHQIIADDKPPIDVDNMVDLIQPYVTHNQHNVHDMSEDIPHWLNDEDIIRSPNNLNEIDIVNQNGEDNDSIDEDAYYKYN